MTTSQAAAQYEAEHLRDWARKNYAVHNPHNKPLGELPVIWGFSNGGSPGWMDAVLLAEDGTFLGSHLCSSTAYMPHDLGILEGARPDRHETFREHYPDGYRMDFTVDAHHPEIEKAYQKNQQLAKESDAHG